MFNQAAELAETQARREALRQRDEIVMLVKQELDSYGLLLSPNIARRGDGPWILHGQPEGLGPNKIPKGFVVRTQLCVGSLRDCCIKAAELLDRLEPGQ